MVTKAKKEKKNYLLDTNVLLHDANSMFAFEENNVYILVTVLEELDKFKTAPGETGANSRRAARDLDGLREKGKLKDGVELESGGTLYVIPYMKNGLDLDLSLVDNQLLTTAHKLHDMTGLRSVVVTKDVNLRVRADGVDVPAEDYRNDKQKSCGYMGYSDIIVPQELIDIIYNDDEIELPEEMTEGLLPNEYLLLISAKNPKKTALARFCADGIVRTINTKTHCFNIKARNMAQHFALDALFDDSIQLITLKGKAGTGKTLLAMAAGLHQTMNEDKYNKLTITRPVIPVGKDIGFLPGDMDDKMAPWMRPIHDAIDRIKASDGGVNKKTSIPATHNLSQDIDIAPLTYVRGRSIANSFMIVDETQNMTPHEVKTLVTRAGAGTKIIFTGDTDQIDNPYLDSDSNGFSYLVSKFKGQGMFAHIHFSKGERSPLAELAATLM